MSAETATFVIPNDAPEAPSSPPLANPEPRPEPVEEKDSYVEPTDPGPGDEVTRLIPDPAGPFPLENGQMVIARPLRLREFLGMLKIVTRGASVALGELRLNTNDEDFMQSMMALFLFAIPEAEDEACEFLRMMVDPYVESEDPQEIAAAQLTLDAELENPELEDLFGIIEVIVRREGSDLRRLGKRLTNALEFARKTGQN